MKYKYITGEYPEIGDLIHCINPDGNHLYTIRKDKWAVIIELNDHFRVLWIYNKEKVIYELWAIEQFKLLKRKGKEWLGWT